MDDQTLQSIRERVDGGFYGRGWAMWEVRSLLAEVDRLRDGITRHREALMKDQDAYDAAPEDADLWDLIGTSDA